MAFPSISGARCGETGPCEQTRVCPFSPGAPAPVSFTSVPQGRCPDPFQGGLKAKQITERAEPPPRWEEAGLRVGAGLGGPPGAACGVRAAECCVGIRSGGAEPRRQSCPTTAEVGVPRGHKVAPRASECRPSTARPCAARPGPGARGPGRRCRVPGASGRQEGGRRGRSVTVAPGACWAVLGGNGKRWSREALGRDESGVSHELCDLGPRSTPAELSVL